MTSRNDLPQQPTAVREWIESHNRATRAINATVAGAFRGGLGVAEVMEIRDEFAADLADVLAPMPIDIKIAYEAWAIEYNATVDKINAERQARINAREANKIRSAACPICFATHPGEC